MPYVVKKIAGKQYVYKQFRVGKKVLSIYVGPLDKIAEFYLTHKDHLDKTRHSQMGPGPRFELGIFGSTGRCVAATPPGPHLVF